MTALVQAPSRLTRTDVEIETFKTVLIFCGLGLLASLLYSLDLAIGCL